MLSLEHHKKVSVSIEQLSLALTNSAQDNHYLLFILKHLSKYRIRIRVGQIRIQIEVSPIL